MTEKELQFDRKKHVCYSREMKKVMLEHLHRHYSNEQSEIIWEDFQNTYVEFLKDLPDLGGNKSQHNGAGGTYDSISLFAYYKACPDKPDLNELNEMILEVCLPPFKKLGKLFNVNKPFTRYLLRLAFKITAKGSSESESIYPNYIMEVADKEDKSVSYCFKRCPIAEFAKQHGYTYLMPAICNGDYPLFEALHGTLIRKSTCANGDICDYRIIGDNNPEIKNHQRKTDGSGYWYNE